MNGRSAHHMKAGLDIVGLVLAAISAYFLWRGSEESPWPIQSWAGQSEAEKMFRKRRSHFSTIGFAMLGMGFLLQLVSRLF
jgi:hypothetical protein